MSSGRRRRLVASHGRARLDPGPYWLVWAVDEDGGTWPVIADERLTTTTPMPSQADLAALAPHELEGPLPPAYTDRLDPRCGRPRKDGQPCRSPVARFGGHCGWHREESTSTTSTNPTERTSP